MSDLKAVSDVMADWLAKSIDQITKNLDAKTAAKPGGSNSTGSLRQSIGANLQRGLLVKDDTITLTIAMNDYAEYVDQGRDDGSWPNLGGIKAWIRSKPTLVTKPDPVTGKIPTDDQLAFLIGRKIAEEGIEPTFFYSSVINDKSINKLKEDIAAAAVGDLADKIRTDFKDFNK